MVSLASTLASDLAHLVESMNLADRPTSNTNRTTRYPHCTQTSCCFNVLSLVFVGSSLCFFSFPSLSPFPAVPGHLSFFRYFSVPLLLFIKKFVGVKILILKSSDVDPDLNWIRIHILKNGSGSTQLNIGEKGWTKR